MSSSASQVAGGVWRITRGVPLRIDLASVRESGAAQLRAAI